jgi:kynurenine formamidase
MPFLDLSHTITDGMVTYPGLPGPAITDHLSYDDSRSHYAEGTEFHIAQIDMVANTGTYLDTPAHRWRGRNDLSAIALEQVAVTRHNDHFKECLRTAPIGGCRHLGDDVELGVLKCRYCDSLPRNDG